MTESSLAAISCPLCGHRFDPAAHGSCASCPLHTGCPLVCCPACGYSTVDSGRSALVGLGARIAARLRPGRRGLQPRTARTLAEVAPGRRTRVEGLDDLPVSCRESLRAYGLAAGRWVEVVQQSPVTVVRVEHLDLAFEAEIARGVRVTGETDGAAAGDV